jgi:uncharacterized protein YecT (DUF1311 family)
MPHGPTLRGAPANEKKDPIQISFFSFEAIVQIPNPLTYLIELLESGSTGGHMGKAGGILGIIAGLLGIAAALFTLLAGGLGAAFEAKGASTIVGLGWGGVLFSFLVIIFGAVAFAKPKGAGIGLIICSLAGMVLGGTFVAIVLVLSLVGGLLAVFDKGAAKQAMPAAAAAGGAGGAPPATPTQSQDKPWGTGRMVFYSIFSVLIPIAGLGAGIQGLLSDAKRKQGALLLILGVIGAVIYAVLAMRPQYVQPDDRFLKSELMVRPGISEVGLTVGQFVEVLQKSVMDNGKSPQLKGWTKEENEYTLHLVMKQPVELKFTHLLQPPVNGQASLLAPIQAGLEQVPALQFLMSVVAMVPAQTKTPQQQTPVATSPAQSAAAPTVAKEAQTESEECVERKVAAFRKERGDDVPIRMDMLEEWREQCNAPMTASPSGETQVTFSRSFDCAKASSFSEKAVCEDTLLGRLDGALSQNYQYMLASNIGDGAKNDLRTTQKAWLAERNKCPDKQCLVAIYRKRLDEVCDYPVLSGAHPICASSNDIK